MVGRERDVGIYHICFGIICYDTQLLGLNQPSRSPEHEYCNRGVGLETKDVNHGYKITKTNPALTPAAGDEPTTRLTAGNHGQEKNSTIHPWAASSTTTAFKKSFKKE
jgi:hypothetical protein